MTAIKIKLGKFDDNSADLFAKIDGSWGRIGWVDSDTVCTFSASSASNDEWRIGEYIATLFNPEDKCEEIKVELFSVQGRRLQRELTARGGRRILKSRISTARQSLSGRRTGP